jgi:hypothetical protein
MENLNIDKIIQQLTEWNNASNDEKVILFKQAEDAFKGLYLRSMSYFSFLFGVPSGLVSLFRTLHDSPCRIHENSMECVDSPEQKESFKLLDEYRMMILANDVHLIYRNGWAELIQSLDDAETEAKIVIEIRTEAYRKHLLKRMNSNYRQRIFDTITKLQKDGYATADGDSGFCVSTPDFTSSCGVCKSGYEDGDTMINKSCGNHTSHYECAKQEWGENRVDWLADPCQLCEQSHIKPKLEENE